MAAALALWLFFSVLMGASPVLLNGLRARINGEPNWLIVAIGRGELLIVAAGLCGDRNGTLGRLVCGTDCLEDFSGRLDDDEPVLFDIALRGYLGRFPPTKADRDSNSLLDFACSLWNSPDCQHFLCHICRDMEMSEMSTPQIVASIMIIVSTMISTFIYFRYRHRITRPESPEEQSSEQPQEHPK